MKRIITSASVVALGAAAAQVAKGQGLEKPEKPWNVSATLRGFYDDNYATVPSDRAEESFGVELSPSGTLNWTTDQTVVGLNYTYGLRWFEDREPDEWDHTHQVNAKLSHAFSERYKIDVSDSFVVAQEPEILEPGTVSTLLRSEGDNIRNTFDATGLASLAPKLDLVIGYSNTFFNYEEDDVPQSRSALLDRMEHLARVNLRWEALPETVALLGYQFGVTEYTSDDLLGDPVLINAQRVAAGQAPFVINQAFLDRLDPSVRDNTTHYFYVGADQAFSQQLNASLRVGAQYREYTDSNATRDSTWGPYVDGNITYVYTTGSYAQLGVRLERTATDVAFATGGGDPTLDSETVGVYGSLNHQITAKVNGSVMGQFQHSEFEGGLADGDAENLIFLGVNVSYAINKFLLAEAGYNYDRLDSDLPVRSFSRNRVYVGLRATY